MNIDVSIQQFCHFTLFLWILFDECHAALDKNSKEAVDIVRTHNRYRKKLAKRKTKDVNGKYQPEASNMRLMRWNEKLAASAQLYANKCKFEHDIDTIYGENIGLGTFDDSNIYVRQWFYEIKKGLYKGTSPEIFVFSSTIGHYTQGIWATSSEIGCGAARCRDGKKKILVCRYYTRGNSIGSAMYKIGKPCSGCDDGMVCFNKVFCDIPKKRKKKAKKYRSRSHESVVRTSIKKKISSNSVLKEDSKEAKSIVNLHNKFRRDLAQGKTQDKKRKQQPKASNMMLMRWNYTIAETAQRHADKCKFAHDQKNRLYGENIGYGTYSESSFYVKQWYQEIEHGIYPGATPEKFVYGPAIGHYTQGIWATTSQIGCGIASCGGKKIIIVCRYAKRGNTIGASMYKVGEPCSDCDKGMICVEKALCDINSSEEVNVVKKRKKNKNVKNVKRRAKIKQRRPRKEKADKERKNKQKVKQSKRVNSMYDAIRKPNKWLWRRYMW